MAVKVAVVTRGVSRFEFSETKVATGKMEDKVRGKVIDKIEDRVEGNKVRCRKARKLVGAP